MDTRSSILRELWTHRALVGILVQRNIKIRYKGSTLGFFWSLASPLFFIVLYGVFLKLVARGFAFDLHVLVTGIIIWQFVTLSVSDALGAVVGNANLIKKTAFPRLVLPVSTVMANLINFLMSGLVLLLYLLLSGASIRWALAGWIPVIVLTQTALCIGLSSFVAAVNVFFRDAEHLLGHLLMAWFFATPILYPLSLPLEAIRAHLPPAAVALYFCNPMTGLVTAYRRILLDAPLDVPVRLVALSCAMAWLILLGGVALFQKTQSRFGDEL